MWTSNWDTWSIKSGCCDSFSNWDNIFSGWPCGNNWGTSAINGGRWECINDGDLSHSACDFKNSWNSIICGSNCISMLNWDFILSCGNSFFNFLVSWISVTHCFSSSYGNFELSGGIFHLNWLSINPRFSFFLMCFRNDWGVWSTSMFCTWGAICKSCKCMMEFYWFFNSWPWWFSNVRNAESVSSSSFIMCHCSRCIC